MRRPARKLVVSAVAVFAVFVLCVAYIVSVVLDSPLTERARNVSVELTATGGLFRGSVVTYRGVKVGKVTSIRFSGEGVVANARITSDDEIPTSSKAVVRSLSPVGEQYLDFQPQGTKGPYLADGDRIRATHTDIPRTLASTVISVNKLLEQLDEDQLATVLDESSRALTGTGDELGRLTDQAELIVGDLNRLWPTTERLLVDGDTLLDIGIDNRGRLVQTARDAKLVARFLEDFDPELRRALRDAPGQVRQLQGLLDDAREIMPAFLRLGAGVTGLIASYEPHLRTLLVNFGPGLGVLGKAVKGGVLQLDAIGQADTVCDYGTPQRAPENPERRSLVTDRHCPGGFRAAQRGAEHAPGPVR